MTDIDPTTLDLTDDIDFARGLRWLNDNAGQKVAPPEGVLGRQIGSEVLAAQREAAS